jgi:hypothetical protein
LLKFVLTLYFFLGHWRQQICSERKKAMHIFKDEGVPPMYYRVVMKLEE